MGLDYEHEESAATATTCPIIPIFFIRRLARLSELRQEFRHMYSFASITCYLSPVDHINH